MKAKLRLFAAVLAFPLLAVSCGLGMGGNAIYMLVDVSGTYHRELPRAVSAVKYLLARARPNDFLAVAKISSRSFSDREIIFSEKFPDRPSETNARKLALREKIDRLAKSRATLHTDIRGALYQVTHTLAAQKNRRKIMIIFSDLVEDISADVDRKMALPDFSGVHVLAVDIIKLRSDNKKPDRYFRRIERWRHEFMQAGAAGFRVVDDPAQLPDIIRQLD